MTAADPIRSLVAGALFDGERWRGKCRIVCDDDGCIVAIERAPHVAADAPVLIPGLVNAHTHLELGELLAPPPGRFVDWLRAVIRDRLSHESQPGRERAAHNLAAALAGGTTVFGDIDTLAGAWAVLGSTPVRGISYRELVGFDLGPAPAQALVERCLTDDGPTLRFGLSPHAPYSISEPLLEAVLSTGRPLAIHASETEEEVRFVRTGDGPFRDLLLELDRWDGNFVPPGCSPLAWLDRVGVLGPRCLLVHMQVLEPGDLEILARSGSPVVICPGTIEYFGRRSPRIAAMQAVGVTVALGTDSLASNRTLDMLDAMSGVRRLCPDLAPETVLRMASSDGGAALETPGAGRLAVGERLDAVSFPDLDPSHSPRRLGEAITSGAGGSRRIVLNGRWLPRSGLYDRLFGGDGGASGEPA